MTKILETASEQDAFKTAMGKCLHYLRITHKLSLEAMGVKLGVTAQQVHKYETGQSIVAPVYLQRYAKEFSVPVGYFFGEMGAVNACDYDIDRKALSITSEIVSLPDDVRMGLYHLAQMINRNIGKKKAA